jgi:hypothetical protein
MAHHAAISRKNLPLRGTGGGVYPHDSTMHTNMAQDKPPPFIRVWSNNITGETRVSLKGFSGFSLVDILNTFPYTNL